VPAGMLVGSICAGCPRAMIDLYSPAAVPVLLPVNGWVAGWMLAGAGHVCLVKKALRRGLLGCAMRRDDGGRVTCYWQFQMPAWPE